jgi:hypothetical protein
MLFLSSVLLPPATTSVTTILRYVQIPASDVFLKVGGVHSHLVARVQGDLEQSGRPTSHQEVMTTVFPMFQQDIEPHLMHAHVSS